MKFHPKQLTKISLGATLVYLAIFGGASSCISSKSIVYFQGDSLQFSSQNITQKYTPTIQANDILSIIVGSLNSEANEVFNTPNVFTTASTNYSTTAGGARVQPLGYLVNSDGSIEIPLVGKLNVQGLRTTDAADSIRVRLQNFLKEPSVIVRNLNFKVSVLGEVARPSIYVIPDEKITLPEVLSLAGDLTIFGKRDNVMVVREEDGIRSYARIDLTKRDIFNSPYYYVHKNDIIYIEPIKTRINATDRNVQLVPIVTSIAAAVGTLGILILNFTK
ncbi:polysaccharide biosynthesis/export family protein [Dyadobacter pollutisoli]|uniref:Polysaccharide biosynthesis/export family protein n=1 Tax=Dyadobacter pollutisoli TaxID=2910158 RepID=A0A9E8SMY7_9BACT|nr:polysaccharide biosynthesis/export family protein [Dyadobacter pollutisoli]WAC13231.1 polysaccharide biosynthesis/export family protein [Dyadobacter pollutisoli]